MTPALSSLFFRQWRVTLLTLLLILASGLSALLTIGRQEDPTITNLFATVVTPYPGADPARVEALVTEPIEQELRQIAEITEINSTSRTGISVVQVELQQTLPDETLETVWSEVRDSLADAALLLPQGVPEPEFDNDRTGAFSAIMALQMRPDRRDDAVLLRRYADLLADRLRQISGTKQVEVYGDRVEEILVEVDSTRLASLGITIGEVAQAISDADAKVAAGRLRGREADLLVEVSGEIDALERVAGVPLRQGADGPLLRVGDVADLSRSLVEPADMLAYSNGRPAVLVAAKMIDDLQVDAWMGRIQRELDRFQQELPAGLEKTLVFDQSRYTADRLSGLLGNLAIGIGLVVLVLILSLGWRAALIVALTIPLATFITLAVLRFVGIPIQQMSVTGLIVALGLLVDAAIVMSDEIRRRIGEGSSRLAAVEASISRLAGPLLASTVTTVLAFMPMALLPGPAGDFVGSIAIAVITMLFASLALSLTVTPALAGRFLKLPPAERRLTWWEAGIQPAGLSRLFNRSVGLALRNPLLGILAGLVLPVIGFGAFPTLQAQFFPGVDRDQLYLQVMLPSGTALAATETAALKADAVLRAQPEVAQVQWVVGESAPAFYYNMLANQDNEPRFAEALITTRSAEATEILIPRLQGALDRALPQARALVRGLVQGPPVNAPLEMRIVGTDLDLLRELGQEARALMSQVASVTHTKAQLPGGAPKLQFQLDEDKVRLAGLDLVSAARQLDSLAEGVTGGSLLEGPEELRVRVRLAESARDGSHEFGNLNLVAPEGSAMAASGAYPGVPLSALGEGRLIPAETPISRKDGERINTVQGFIQRDVLPEEALKDFQALLAASPLTLPPGYRIEWGGDADERDETVQNLAASAGLIVVLTVAAIVLTFNSFRLSLITGIVALLSMGLSLFCLAVFQYPFGINALIGVIGSIGVSINAAIIILTAMQRDPDAAAGDVAAMQRVVSSASRHIVSTTVTTFGGFLPLILAGGGFWPPFAMSIAGGVLLSTVVSLYFTPSAYALMTRRRVALTVRPASG
ncbi:MAG: efflux RND transporter permease subunit [Rhodospirillales bacterium]